MSKLHLPVGSATAVNDPLLITPERAGWRYTGLSVIRLEAGEERRVSTGDREMLVLPLSGGCTVELDGKRLEVLGREDVFSGISDFAYLPVRSEARIAATRAAEVALPWAIAERRLQPGYGDAQQVPVEIRGAGRATRQITNLCIEDTFPADRLAVVEVLTPPGNWSSYPPHKHDDATVEGESELEEIYYFRINGENGLGLHYTYTADGELNDAVAVRDGDAFLIPRGYHGPCAASPDHAMYYLNVLAGPHSDRSLACMDDPAFAWIRGTWADQPLDPRLPMTSATARVEAPR